MRRMPFHRYGASGAPHLSFDKGPSAGRCSGCEGVAPWCGGNPGNGIIRFGEVERDFLHLSRTVSGEIGEGVRKRGNAGFSGCRRRSCDVRAVFRGGIAGI